MFMKIAAEPAIETPLEGGSGRMGGSKVKVPEGLPSEEQAKSKPKDEAKNKSKAESWDDGAWAMKRTGKPPSEVPSKPQHSQRPFHWKHRLEMQKDSVASKIVDHIVNTI